VRIAGIKYGLAYVLYLSKAYKITASIEPEV